MISFHDGLSCQSNPYANQRTDCECRTNVYLRNSAYGLLVIAKQNHGELGTRMHALLSIHVFHVLTHRAFADVELRGRLLVRQTRFRQETDDFFFSRRELARRILGFA